ncbi:MAG TPA: DinB family protein [Candidatus Angelobacter sp.]|nr:DinB family protein [Candidatus Angelobacter sp.]
MDLNDIRELYVYNRWANHRSLAAAAKLDNATFIRPMGNSFSSVRDTLAHILSGEWIWLERWNGISPTALLDAAAFPTVESLKVRWETVEQGYHEFLHSLSLARLQKNLAYINRAGQPYEYPLWQQMVHVVNHSSYHRGQVTTLLRQLGAQPIATDFLEYYDEKNA